MYKVIRGIYFNYGHRLLNYEGKCAYLHGHNGRLLIELSAEKLNDQNMVMDFHEIKRTMEAWIDETLDHQVILWDQDPLCDVLKKAGQRVAVMTENPTAEAIARWIYEKARQKGLPVTRVSLSETADCTAEYSE